MWNDWRFRTRFIARFKPRLGKLLEMLYTMYKINKRIELSNPWAKSIGEILNEICNVLGKLHCNNILIKSARLSQNRRKKWAVNLKEITDRAES